MNCDLGRAVKTGRHDGAAYTHRGVALHIMVAPGTCPEAAGQHRIEAQRYSAREANLSAVSMPAEQQIELGMCSLLVHLRGMG